VMKNILVTPCLEQEAKNFSIHVVRRKGD
jgi:hypothetical protein